ncbi:MAG: AMP-binding protein [Solirubrobacteraceae bacterium]
MALPNPLSSAGPTLARVRDELRSLKACKEAGVLSSDGIGQLRDVLKASRAFGLVGGGIIGAAIRHGDRPAVIDERGTLSFVELDRRTNAIANHLRAQGLKPGQGVAILVRNHRGWHDAFYGTLKAGGKAILMNTEFAGPQLKDVFAREGAEMLIHDDEFAAAAGAVDPPLGKVRSFTEDGATGDGTIEGIIASASGEQPPTPARQGSFVILTSGTTGTPKGANRQQPKTLTLMGGIVERVPFRGHETTLIAAPLFHSLGLVHAVLALNSGTAVVLQRRFRPDAVLDAMAEHRATGLICVPIMLSRLLDAYDDRADKPDLSALRIAFVAGSQLGTALALRAQDRWGDVVYNLYGSTEVALATIATPQHLKVSPDTVGPPTLGTRLRIIDEQDREVPTGTTGRIVVANVTPFEGYTGGGGKAVVDGMMASGDVGHVNAEGWLFIDGRDDSMIVSGGENVFPDEVEDLIAKLEGVSEVAAIGVPDETYGQRIRTFIVKDDDAPADLDGDRVRTYVKENLARYKVPRDVIFLDELPRNPTGKVLKRKLVEYEVESQG